MTQSPAALRRRGGKGLYKTPANGLRNPGTKSKPKKLPEYLEPDEVGSPFNDLQFPTDIVLLSVLWRLRYKLGFRDVAELL